MEMVRAAPHGISEDQLAPLLEEHESGSLDLLEAMIGKGLLPKESAARLWGDSIGIAYVEPITTIINREAIELVPHEVAQKARVLPLYLFDTILTVAMADPRDTEMIQKLSQIARHPITAVFSLPSEIEAALAIHYLSEKSVRESLAEIKSIDLKLTGEMSAEKIAEVTENASLIQVVNSLLYFALRERTSDIHIEARETITNVRFRIDGILREVLTFPRKLHVAIVSRLKILCNVDITESRFPQDGRFSLALGTNRADFRLSFMPTVHGEKVVIRILAFGSKKDFIKLDQMLISQTILQPFKRVIQNPNGIIFVTGPTGSGKTTTLYAALAEINNPGVNITTIEDPVELQVEGLSQSQVNGNIDLSFGRLLRAILRQDPDVILVGEVRDADTARIAVQSALTGHFVLSSLHGNDSVSAVHRLLDMGIEAFLVASAVVAVVSQRLVRRLCDNCKEEYTPTADEIAVFRQHSGGSDKVHFFRGRGCSYCSNTGYHGRIGVYELLKITPELRRLIVGWATTEELRRLAVAQGMRTMLREAMQLVEDDVTTIPEVVKTLFTT